MVAGPNDRAWALLPITGDVANGTSYQMPTFSDCTPDLMGRPTLAESCLSASKFAS